MSVMPSVRLMNLGSVRITHDYDQRQFWNVVLLVLMVAALLFWAYQDHLLERMFNAIGPVFTTAFSVLLGYGVFYGMYAAWHISSGMDAIKRAEHDARALKAIFKVDDFSKVDVAIIREQVSDELYVRIDKVQHTANLAVLLGLFGTAWGILETLGPLRAVTAPDEVMKQLPSIVDGLMLSFATTLVGIAVYVPLVQMFRFLRNAGLNLKNHSYRVLHEKASG